MHVYMMSIIFSSCLEINEHLYGGMYPYIYIERHDFAFTLRKCLIGKFLLFKTCGFIMAC